MLKLLNSLLFSYIVNASEAAWAQPVLMSLRSAPCSQGLLVFQNDSGKLENEKTLRTTRLTVAFPVISNVYIVHCACFNDASGNPGAHSGNLIPRFYSFSNIPSPYWKTRRPWGRGCSFGPFGPQLFSIPSARSRNTGLNSDELVASDLFQECVRVSPSGVAFSI